MTYPGGKNAPGVAQLLTNSLPPHRLYIEPFLGSGALMRAKTPATISIGIDLDPLPLAKFAAHIPHPQTRPLARVSLALADALPILEASHFTADTLIYCDPPYPASTLTNTNRYKCTLKDTQHEALLKALTHTKAHVAISSYPNPGYAHALRSWHCQLYRAQTRGTPRAEALWTNWQPNAPRGDLRSAGATFRERERIKRKRQRWLTKFATLQPIEAAAILADLNAAFWSP